MSYTDGRDFTSEYTRTLSDGIVVELAKFGGGTVGESYQGTWEYRIDGAYGRDFHTGTPKTHAEALAELVDFLYADDDETPEILAQGGYVATINVPGYLPMDDNPPVFETAREAWQYLVSEVDRSWDEFPEDENGACVEAHTQMHNIDQNAEGTVYAPTPGYEGDHDLGLAYCVSYVPDALGSDRTRG